MGKLFCIIGKSAVGKSTLLDKILDQIKLTSVIEYTTRPKRTGEEDGIQYYFVSKEEFKNLVDSGEIVEHRTYFLEQEPWLYGTKKIQIDSEKSFIISTTIQAAENMLEYYKYNNLVLIYLELNDYERLQRAILREKDEEKPNYPRLCRRFLLDENDFLDIDKRLGHFNAYRIDMSYPIDNCVKQFEEIYYIEVS